MILTGYGIRLIRLRHEHLNMVREHRNSQRIQQFMEFRDYISPEMQEQWFQSVNNKEHGHYLIELDNRLVGLINGSEIDWEKKETRSGGIFIWEESLWRTEEPLKASLLLTDISFILGLERTYIRVLRDNAKAIAFNKQLGYELLPNQEDVENQEYVLHEAPYLQKTKRYREILQRKFSLPFQCIMDHPTHPMEQWIQQYFPTLPEANRQKIELIFP